MSESEYPFPSDDPEFVSERPTLVEAIEPVSIPGGGRMPKNRALLTVLTGPEKGAVYRIPPGPAPATLGRSDEARPHFAAAYRLLSQDPWLSDSQPERLARLERLGAAES